MRPSSMLTGRWTVVATSATAAFAAALLVTGFVPGLGSAAAHAASGSVAAIPTSSPTSTPTPTAPSVDRGTVVEVPRDWAATKELFRRLPVGSTFSVSLFENPSTGYSWAGSLPATTPTVVSYLDKDYVPDAAPPGTVGSGGTRYFRYHVDGPGNVTITLTYRRPWETQILQQVTLHIMAGG